MSIACIVDTYIDHQCSNLMGVTDTGECIVLEEMPIERKKSLRYAGMATDGGCYAAPFIGMGFLAGITA